MQCGHLIFLADLVANPELVQGRQRRTEEVGLVGVCIAVNGRVDHPFDEAEGGIETRGQTVADGTVKVVAEEEIVAVDGVFEDDGEADGVLVVLMKRVVEVRVCLGGVIGVAWTC